MHILILGGTSEAGALADALGARGVRATLSYAGRTRAPRPPPPGVAMRV
ncbi:MAG: precorrin-6A/cobalt-precorrin-6A reductase, partial [Paracoccus sp. (in: a-proteobacteria)]|nr:precorrin-6A/cobalt-precorrin-6A reductase [Paracoccus sp. (in: a-proteobacteria)]